jgi:hypothetical protein
MTRYLLCLTVTVLILWGALSDERTGLPFVHAAGPCQRKSFLGPSPLGPATLIYCLRFDTSLFFAFYDSQGHGGGIQSQSHTETDGQSVSLGVARHLGLMAIHLFLFDSYGHEFYGAPSLTRGRGYRLYMLLAFASAVFLESESLGTRHHNYCLRYSGVMLPYINSAATASNSSPIVVYASLVANNWWLLDLATGMFVELFPSNGCLSWFQNSNFSRHATILKWISSI